MEQSKHASTRRIADGLLVLAVAILLMVAGWVFYEWRTDGSFNAILLMMAFLPLVLAFLARSTLSSTDR